MSARACECVCAHLSCVLTVWFFLRCLVVRVCAGSAILQFATHEAAKLALAYNKYELLGRPIKVSFSKPTKKERKQLEDEAAQAAAEADAEAEAGAAGGEESKEQDGGRRGRGKGAGRGPGAKGGGGGRGKGPVSAAGARKKRQQAEERRKLALEEAGLSHVEREARRKGRAMMKQVGAPETVRKGAAFLHARQSLVQESLVFPRESDSDATFPNLFFLCTLPHRSF